MLPEIGGRIFKAHDKCNNNYDFFYKREVIKPALVGLAGPWIIYFRTFKIFIPFIVSRSTIIAEAVLLTLIGFFSFPSPLIKAES